jgi:hypothetical protein
VSDVMVLGESPCTDASRWISKQVPSREPQGHEAAQRASVRLAADRCRAEWTGYWGLAFAGPDKLAITAIVPKGVAQSR